MNAPENKKWLRSFLKPIMPVFREVLAMSFFVNILALAAPVFTLQVYDRVVYHAGISTLEGLVLGMFAVLVFDYVLRQSRSRVMQRVALRVDVIIGQQLFDKFVSLPMKTLESKPGAHWQSLFRDVDTVRNTLSGASAVLMADLPFAILFFGVIFVIAPALAFVLLFLLPVFVFVAWRSGNVMADANRDERETSQSRDGLIAEMIAGRTTIKALALDQAMRPVWEEKHAENTERAVTRGGKTDSFTNLGATLTMLTTICLTTVGAIAIIDQRLTIGALIATNMLSGRLIGPLNQLVSQWRTYSGFKQAVERLTELFDEPSERVESEIKLSKPRGEITVENAGFAYAEGSAPVLNKISVKIDQGGVNALVGRNGSGKTTLLKVLQGLYLPDTGRVLLDGADISQFSRSELATWIGYVPQENVLFSGTVRENIAHRMPEASDDEIIRAAKAAGVHQFIIDLPDGYATDIGEAGRKLSGGQRQRISIARALVGEPPVLLLDEPSSSLDRQAEHELRKTLDEIGKSCTVVIVTHSPILLSACRDLIALDRGKVALVGPASDILPRLFGGAARPVAPSQNDAAVADNTGTPASAAVPQPRAKSAAPRGNETLRRAAPSVSAVSPGASPTARNATNTQASAEIARSTQAVNRIDLLPPLGTAETPSTEQGATLGLRIPNTPNPLLGNMASAEVSRPRLSADAKTQLRKIAEGITTEAAPSTAGTKPVLRVDPAGRSSASFNGNSVRPPVRHRPHLTVTQGGKKANGTNGMTSSPDRDELE